MNKPPFNRVSREGGVNTLNVHASWSAEQLRSKLLKALELGSQGFGLA